jgi:Ion transport protein
VWKNYDVNCDNIGSAMMFLFILSSFEGWPDYVWYFLDADESGPTLFKSTYFAGFFTVFIFVGSFFSINLFSAIMSFNFDIA